VKIVLLDEAQRRFEAEDRWWRDNRDAKELMAEVKIFHDREGQTLTVWFTDPSLEHVAEETGDEVILMKDRSGREIGFEKLNFSVPDSDSVHVAVETAPA
jgi:hypothetical protein